MPQQRIHEITSKRLLKLKESINIERKKIGEKPMTVPDIIESIVDMFESNRNEELRSK